MRLVDFSRQIGVSPTTVSQAINGTGRVSPATRAMVCQRMLELGYLPNPHAQQLVTGRSQMAVLHHTNQDMLTDLFLVELTHGIQHALHRRSYGLLLDTASDFAEDDAPLNLWLRTEAVDGVILINGWSDVTNWVRRFASPRTPIVLYGQVPGDGLPHTGNFVVETSEAICQVAECLVGAGHRRIGYLGIHAPDPTREEFRRALAALGVGLPDEMAVTAGFSPADGARGLRELLARPVPPTAVFCRKDDLAIGAMNAAARLGVCVPEQLSLIGHDDVPMAAVMDPPLSTVHIDCNALGEAAADLLISLLEIPNTRPDRRVIRASFVSRGSVAAKA